MDTVIVAIGLLALLGVAGALLLYFTSRRWGVADDPRVDSVTDELPGANCGGCGYKGCRDFAKACVDSVDSTGGIASLQCPVGGRPTMEAVADILGVSASATVRRVAVLRCAGTCSVRKEIAHYDGPRSCAVETNTGAGTLSCPFGCLGCGDCVDVCTFGGIYIDQATGIAAVDPDVCTACGACVKACPRNLLSITDVKPQALVACSNTEKGAVARAECSAACIACTKCVRVCPEGAMSMGDNVAVCDASKCTACGKCVEGCPTGAISLIFVNGTKA